MRVQNVYYCRAMDGLAEDAVRAEYGYLNALLTKRGFRLVNAHNHERYEMLPLNHNNAVKVVEENLDELKASDYVIINFSIPNHLYVGCIGEMIYAKISNKRVIVIAGDSGVDKHFWTLYHADALVKTLDEAIVQLELMRSDYNG